MPDRPPIDVEGVLAHVGPEVRLEVVTSTESTNADLLLAAAAGAPAWTVLVADLQTAGRGRRDRTWTSPPRAGLTVSVLLRPTTAPRTWSWFPLLAGVAVCDALASLGVDGVGLKWPNDVLLDDGKLAGILVQSTADAVVIGTGINIDTTAAELPTDAAISLALARPDLALRRDAVLTALLRALRGVQDLAADAARTRYLGLCRTVGQHVRVSPVGGRPYEARAVDVDARGALVLERDGRREALLAGDVETLRAVHR